MKIFMILRIGMSCLSILVFTIFITAPAAVQADSVRIIINFQPLAAPPPSGHLVDDGAAFGHRGNGYNYGWSSDNRSNARDRNSGNSPDQRYDTLNHMQNGGTFTWQIAVPNGEYQVRVVAGDPSYFDSVYRISVEGVVTVDGTPTVQNPWVEGTQTVMVNDGKLTVSNASGAYKNKICFIEIFNNTSTSEPPPPTAPTGITGNGSGDQVVLTWSPNSDTDLAGYNIYRDLNLPVDTGQPPINGNVLLTGTSFLDRVEQGSTAYYYVVEAVDSVGRKSTSEPVRVDIISDEAGWESLFNGVNLDGWYTWLPSTGRDNDPKGIFKVHDGMIHILDIPVSEENQEFGYLSTLKEYADYHLRFQYKWGTKRFAPRSTLKRDSGVIYHVVGQDKLLAESDYNTVAVWPRSVECQVQEGDTGDLYLLGNTSLTTTVASTTVTPIMYKEGGVIYTKTKGRVAKSGTTDLLSEWNTVDVIVSGNQSVHIVNGVVNNQGIKISQPDPDASASRIPLMKGRIALQAEGAEIYYRNIQIRPLSVKTTQSFRVLIFSKTSGFRHESIPSAVAAIKELGTQNGFAVDVTEDAAAFNDSKLAQYKAVIFLMTTGDVLNSVQQTAFERYIRAGNGYVGIHSASDTEYSWPWYGGLVGAYFSDHPPVQPALAVVEDRGHDSTRSLPLQWPRTDEWYNFRSNPRNSVKVLARLHEGSYNGGKMEDHPITWYHVYDGGRAWYTAGGHTKQSYSESLFRLHLLGGINYAAGVAQP